MRVIAPEKEVMIGGASLCIREGFGGRRSQVLFEARRGRAKAKNRIAVSTSALPHVRWEREGGLAMARSRTAAIDEPPFARRRDSSADTFSCSADRMVLEGSCGGQHMTHVQTDVLCAPSSARPGSTSLLPRANEDPTAALIPTPYLQQHSRHLSS
jgi:hypothetical protein